MTKLPQPHSVHSFKRIKLWKDAKEMVLSALGLPSPVAPSAPQTVAKGHVRMRKRSKERTLQGYFKIAICPEVMSLPFFLWRVYKLAARCFAGCLAGCWVLSQISPLDFVNGTAKGRRQEWLVPEFHFLSEQKLSIVRKWNLPFLCH